MMWWCGCLQYNRTYGRRPAIFYDFAAAAAALSSLCLAAQKKVYLFDKEFVPGGHFINKRLAIFSLSLWANAMTQPQLLLLYYRWCWLIVYDDDDKGAIKSPSSSIPSYLGH